MFHKINRKQNFQSIFKLPIFTILFLILIYTRFVNIGWGLPYPMHPDERNMAVAVQNLNCEVQISKLKVQSCFNPHFFAYGQFPLYLSYLLIVIYKFLIGTLGTSISFVEATMSLRVISGVASIINWYVLVKIIRIMQKSKIREERSETRLKDQRLLNFDLGFGLCTLIFALVPFSIQFAHFGTTESLLMLFYSLIVYLSLRLIDKSITEKKFVLLSSLFSGLAIATKVSSLLFLFVPVIGLILKIKNQRLETKLKVQKFLIFGFGFGIGTLIFALVFSPHNLISWEDFITAIRYESMVATGKSLVFYTRQFFGSLPIIFQLSKIFPYALGWPLFILFLLGFFFLPWQDKDLNFLRFSFLVYFLPTAFLFAKWTRFMAPVFPILLILGIIFLEKINVKKIIKIIIVIISILPGIFYLSIYQKPDVRFQASEWFNKNAPNNSLILSETANVVNIPLPVPSKNNSSLPVQTKNFEVINFNFYELDKNYNLQQELKEYLKKADYILVPSRRVFMNHTCIKQNFQFSIFNFQSGDKCQFLKKEYPLVNAYYEKLFSGRLGFKQVAVFYSGFISDEQAEETWSVFDHPVIRIFKKET